MSSKKPNKDSNFIPSPYKAVTSYENAFIQAWNEMLSASIKDILKYVAKVTSDTIKNSKIK